MFTIQVDKTLQQFITIFYQVGIWQSDDESYRRRIGKKLFYTFFGALLPIFLATNAILCADRSESFFSVQAAILTAVEYLKFLYLFFKKPEILAFLFDQDHIIENREEYEQTNKNIKKFMGFVRPYCIVLFVTSTLLIVSKLPIFSADKCLPFFISFSWNESEIIYWFAYSFLSLSILLCVTINLITPLIWYIMLNYSIKYELLGNKLKNLGVTTDTNQDKDKKQLQKIKKKGLSQKTFISIPQNNNFVEYLIALVKAHRHLTETVERFRSCFSTLFLAQIVTGGIVICVSVYNLTFASKESIVQMEMYVVMLLYGLFDVFLIMHLGNGITVSSDRLSYCLFESNWLDQTELCKKYVLIMGEMLKQPQQLVILIYPMNLETFVRVANGAYSMFNILKRILY